MSKDIERYVINIFYEQSLLSKLSLTRQSEPLLIERIIKALPLTSSLLKLNDKILLPINVQYKSSKKINKHTEGEISFDPINKALVIYLASKEDNYERIGYVLEGLENLKNIKSGTYVLITK